MPKLQRGNPNNIKSMLSTILKKKEFTDLTFLCQDGVVLKCHKFIVGSQSSYLKKLFLQQTQDGDDNVTVISLPEYKSCDFQIVLKFLYTGRLKITAEQVDTVKELLEDILRIDAKITLPKTSPIQSKAEVAGDESQDKGGANGDSRSSHQEDPNASSKGSSSPDNHHSMAPNTTECHQKWNGKGDQDQEEAAMPNLGGHDIPAEKGEESSESKIRERVIESNRVMPPSPPDSDNELAYINDQGLEDAGSVLEVIEPPAAISEPKSSDNVHITTARDVVAKPRKRHPTVDVDIDQDTAVPNKMAREDADMQGTTTNVSPGSSNPESRPGRTRTQTGSLNNYPCYIDIDDELESWQLGSLPPPIPVPPEEGMVIKAGVWVHPSESETKCQSACQKNSKVKRYNYKPFATISGTSKPETLLAAEECDGEFPCPYEGCYNMYARERSLQSHISRNHHENLKASCPECGKKLSSTAAISKHLLSHRPRQIWPYFCPLCGRKFQAKGDIPKHLLTKQHVNEIPGIGSQEWVDLINSGVCAPQTSWRHQVLDSVTPRISSESVPMETSEYVSIDSSRSAPSTTSESVPLNSAASSPVLILSDSTPLMSSGSIPLVSSNPYIV